MDDVCTPIAESEEKRVIALFGTVKIIDVIDKYCVFTKEWYICRSYWENAHCWHVWLGQR